MNCLLKRISKFIYSKRKQIVFALFALICIILDKDDSIGLLKSAAPAVVAAAASSAAASGTAATGAAAAGGAAAGGTGAAAAGGASASAGTTTAAGTVANSGNAVSTVNGAASTTSIPNTGTNMNINNVPKNTNPNAYKSDTLSSNTIKKSDIKSSNELGEATNKSSQKAASKSEVETESKNGKNNRLNPELNKDDDSEDEVILDNAAKEVTKGAGGAAVGCIFASIFILIFSIPLIILLIINADTSTMSQVDCSILAGGTCIEEESDVGFFEKLKNLFVYGAYGSNSEVVLKELEESYTKIKEEYDFIISLPVLVSSLFSDSEYIKTDVEGSNIVITDKMMDRVQYIYDMAMLQLIPKYHIFTCNVELVDNINNIYDYTAEYEYTLTPTYDEDDTTEAIAETIPTGTCNNFTAGGKYKEVTYYFDEELYYERLKISEELDLVYADYVESDELLVSKIKTQYTLYKYINQINDVSAYSEVPSELQFDEKVNLQTPLNGSYSITSPFGMREGEYEGMHNGIDLVSSDKNIYAAGTGVVTRSNVETEGGNVIEITHTDSTGRQYVTQYAHLSERLVNVGDIVTSGDIIGIMGDTGTMASGVHLHFSMWDKDTSELLNPRKLFSDATNY